MPSLINRITNFSRTPQARGLMSQVQERLMGGGGKTKSRGRSRAAGRRTSARTARRGRRR